MGVPVHFILIGLFHLVLYYVHIILNAGNSKVLIKYNVTINEVTV
jgi:hypothetical protein